MLRTLSTIFLALTSILLNPLASAGYRCIPLHTIGIDVSEMRAASYKNSPHEYRLLSKSEFTKRVESFKLADDNWSASWDLPPFPGRRNVVKANEVNIAEPFFIRRSDMPPTYAGSWWRLDATLPYASKQPIFEGFFSVTPGSAPTEVKFSEITARLIVRNINDHQSWLTHGDDGDDQFTEFSTCTRYYD
jgi:hypothetical protein